MSLSDWKKNLISSSSSKAVISNTLIKIYKLALLVAYNTPLRETQGENLVRIYTTENNGQQNQYICIE